MKRLHAVFYDCEIVNAIPARDEERLTDITYCGGWRDFVGMGVSVICAIDLWTRRPHIFLEDNLEDFATLCAARGNNVFGFSSKNFDDLLLQAHGLNIVTNYDLKDELFACCRERGGKGARTLSEFARVNLGAKKPMSGALAPIMWQQGKRGKVINYGMGDVHLGVGLLDKAPEGIIDPVTGRTLMVRQPPGADEQITLAA